MPLIQNTDFGKNSEGKFRMTVSIGLFAQDELAIKKYLQDND